jgi:hypothetical protein
MRHLPPWPTTLPPNAGRACFHAPAGAIAPPCPGLQLQGRSAPTTGGTELPRVLPLWPRELDDETFEGRQRILAKLRRALRAERRRGLAGHWTYDLARHVELLRVYRIELAAERRE